MQNDILKHYGVLGMKWGVRHDSRVKTARQNMKSANKQRNKSNREYSRAYEVYGKPTLSRTRTQYNFKKLSSANEKAVQDTINYSNTKKEYKNIKKQVTAEKKNDPEYGGVKETSKKLLGGAVKASALTTAVVAAYGTYKVYDILYNPIKNKKWKVY